MSTPTSSDHPLNALAQNLKSKHIPGTPLILTNVHDAHTAYLISSLPSCPAIATASYSIAATLGLRDNDLTFTQNLAGIANVVAGVRQAGKLGILPITADIQDGYEDVATTIRELVQLGVVGCNIEDVDCRTDVLRSVDDAVARVRTVVETARDLGVRDFVVNARTDVLGYGGSVEDVIERGKRFLDAGATTVFVWGVRKVELDTEMVRSICLGLDGRVAVQGPGPTKMGVQELRDVGVARISFGPWVWRKSMEAFEAEARRLMEL